MVPFSKRLNAHDACHPLPPAGLGVGLCLALFAALTLVTPGVAEEDAAWSVEESLGGAEKTIEVDTTEGTWMSVDVSPDGQKIAFDLLGNIYTIPFEGGDATAIVQGFSWDMQPRFSPDGESIAFVSDRAGGDNVWVVRASGGEPRQITKESYRLLNNPVWSPDGRFIAARKHFTSTRSLGSGEIWLYHGDGTSAGLQLNEKPNEQKDLGEPAFSPDGKYVYFSQDTTPGSTFLYSKDSNGQIYTIRRIDRESGEIETVVTGAGGSCRPTPSPDGKTLAFVRRVQSQSTLFLHDLESGANRAIYSELDRDMQEIWAIHGVYPAMDFTPDGSGIVFWAGGKIRHIDVATGEARVIPFRVREQHRLKEALRYPVEVAPDTFSTKQLRWVTPSPEGTEVVFQSLGKLWVRRSPDAEPVRLTSQDDHFELYPSFSADGREIVYVTWDDEELGSIRIANLATGAVETVTTGPGHYLEPALSPDGKTLVYRKARGGGVRSNLYSKDPGLYVLTRDAEAPPRRIHRSGRQPFFTGDAARVFFFDILDWNQRFLRSVRVDGSEELTHLELETATEVVIDPTRRWVAFAEGFDAYVAPWVTGGKAKKLGPKTNAVPVRKVSNDAAEGLRFNQDGSRLSWSFGPQLHAVDPGDPHGEPQVQDLSFEVSSARPTETIALVGARIVTMAGPGDADVIDRGTVLVTGNRIAAVGTIDAVDVPEGAETLDVSGKTILPGLIDVHWHGSQGRDEIQPEVNWENYATLAFGVTTVHDPSNDTSTFFAASELQRAGLIVAPRLFSTGTILYGASGAFRAEINSLEDARRHVRRLKASGAFSVKSYNQPRRDQRQMVVEAAREEEMMVVNEGGALFQHNMTMVADGHTGIEHSLSVGAIYDDVLQFWGQSATGNTPTLVVAFGGIEGERYWYQHTDVYNNERLLNFVPRDLVDARSRRRMMAPERDYNHFRTARICKQLRDVGVSIHIGAHGQREGLGAHWEMWMLEQGGMTPFEALRAATIDGARYLGLDGDIGSLEAGKLADLIVLDANPLENLRDSEGIRYTMLNGRLYDALTMEQVAPTQTERPAFWWEE